MTNYMLTYRNACNDFNRDLINENEFKERCREIFTAAFKAGDSRMAIEQVDIIFTMIENGAPASEILKEYDLLRTYFPDWADFVSKNASEYEL